MSLIMLLGLLAQTPPPMVAVGGEFEVVEVLETDGAPIRPPGGWVAERQGIRAGLGAALTANVLLHTDVFGVSAAFRGELGVMLGRFELRLSPSVSGFSGWNGHDGYGYLVTLATEASLRFHVFKFLAFGAGAMPAITAGQFQSCSYDLFLRASCAPLVNVSYVSVAPVLYPVIGTLGANGQHEVALWLFWPLAKDTWTFPSVMLSYSFML